MKRRVLWLSLLAVVVGCSATDGEGCTEGTERCACYPNDTCNEGLLCLSQLCVETPAEPAAAVTAASDAGADRGTSSNDPPGPVLDAGSGAEPASGGGGAGGNETTEGGSGGGSQTGGAGGSGEPIVDPCAPGAAAKIEGCADYCELFLPTCNGFLELGDQYSDDAESCMDNCSDCLTACEAFTEAQLSCRIQHLWQGMCSPEYAIHCPLGGKNGCAE